MMSLSLKMVAGLWVVLLISCGGTAPEEIAVGSKAPSFTLRSLDGEKVKSQAFDGKMTVLNFWATWCQNCRKELPELKELAKNADIRVVGIALDQGGAKAVKPFVQKHNINYTVLLGNERIFNRFQGLAIPYTLLLDRDQRIVSIYWGAIPDGSIEEAIKQQG